jgi:hypothetical protein
MAVVNARGQDPAGDRGAGGCHRLMRLCKVWSGFSSSASAIGPFYDSLMSATVTARLSAAVQELKSATRARHLLRKETPEYQAALDRELRLVSEVRDLAERDRNEPLAESD